MTTYLGMVVTCKLGRQSSIVLLLAYVQVKNSCLYVCMFACTFVHVSVAVSVCPEILGSSSVRPLLTLQEYFLKLCGAISDHSMTHFDNKLVLVLAF